MVEIQILKKLSSYTLDINGPVHNYNSQYVDSRLPTALSPGFLLPSKEQKGDWDQQCTETCEDRASPRNTQVHIYGKHKQWKCAGKHGP